MAERFIFPGWSVGWLQSGGRDVVGLILLTNPIEILTFLAVSEKNPRKTPFFGHCIGQPPPSIWKIPKQKKNTA